MKSEKITKALVDRLQPRGSEYTIWDTELRGFGLRVHQSNRKVYILKYRKEGGRQRKFTLGKHGDLTPDMARRRAFELLHSVRQGEDPAQERRDYRNALTVEELAREYHERIEGTKSDRTILDEKNRLRKTILPAIGALKVVDVTRHDIDRIMTSRRTKPYDANRTLSLLSHMFEMARRWEYIQINPARGIERYRETPRERYLDDDEITRLVDALHARHGDPAADAIWLLLTTGSRRSEVLGATWDEFDLARCVWAKPAHRTKQRRSELIPLPSLAVEVLKRRFSSHNPDVPYVFPRPDGKAPLKEIRKSWESIKKAAGLENLRLHDLRHTFASHLAMQGVSLSLVGRLLGHSQLATTQRYAHLALEPLREVSEKFTNQLIQPTSPTRSDIPGNVVSLPQNSERARPAKSRTTGQPMPA